jgi:hypothetical protein
MTPLGPPKLGLEASQMSLFIPRPFRRRSIVEYVARRHLTDKEMPEGLSVALEKVCHLFGQANGASDGVA